jgi:CRP/FNR family cyclic AMP-dependent transcriptional regulator
MARDEKLARLRAVPMFATLSKRELGLLLRQADELRYPARQQVVKEGTRGEEFWMVIDGELAVERGGREVARLGPGEFFGELAVIDTTTRDATVVSKTPVDLLCIGQRSFWALVEGSPTLMRKMMVGMARRLHEMDAKDSAAKAGKK